MRLNAQQDLFSKPFTLGLHKYGYDTVRNSDVLVDRVLEPYNTGASNTGASNTGASNTGVSSGEGSRTLSTAPIQVKRSDDIGVNVVKKIFCIGNAIR